MTLRSENKEFRHNPEKQARLHDLCRGAFEPIRSAIPSELLLLPGCHLIQNEVNGLCNSSTSKEALLQHIILDMTGSPAVPGCPDLENASLQRTLRRTKRLLSRTNSVLFFRLGVMVLFACMLMATTFLTWSFTRNLNGHSMRSLSLVVRRQLLQTGLSSMIYVLKHASTLSLSLNAMHQQAILNSSNWTTTMEEFQGINQRYFHIERKIQSVAFVSSNGKVIDLTRENHSELLYYADRSNGKGRTVWYSEPVSDISNALDMKSESLGGPFEDSFLSDILSDQKMIWSIQNGGLGKEFVTSAVPLVRNGTKEFLGMSVVTIKLDEVRHYLRNIDLLMGYLCFVSWNASGDASVINFDKAPNPYIDDAITYLKSDYGGFQLLSNETHMEDVVLSGTKFYIDSMPLDGQYGYLNLTAVVIIPRSRIMGELDAQSGTVIKISISAALGVLVGGCLLICCLTRRMSTEMELRQELIHQLVAKHKAEQSSNYKSQFLANMSHEMRTPMAGIIGLLDLLACDALTPDQEMSVAQIRRCATGLLELVNNVLDISNVEAGKMELEVSPFCILEELEAIVDMFAVQSLASGVDITLDLSDEFPYTVKGDVTRIRQIFTNLLSNSVKFTESGHILIRGWTDQSLLTSPRKSSFEECGVDTKIIGNVNRSLKGSDSIRENGKIVLVFEIDDTGCGIPAAMQESVFDQFVQADSSSTRTHGGSGLGLYIVRSLVNMMGGEVHLVQKPKPGTRIRFYLVLEKSRNAEYVTVESSMHNVPTTVMDDHLSTFVGSPMKLQEEAKFPTPELLTRTHAVVALPEGNTKTVTVHWLQKRGVTVTCVDKWENILPTLDKVCRSSLTDFNTIAPGRAIHEPKDMSYLHVESPVSPFALPSGGSSSCVSEIMTDWSRYPVLALIDVTLASQGMVPEIHMNDITAVHVKQFDDGKVSENLKYIINNLQQLQSKNDLLVAWVTAPKSNIFLRQMLESLSPSITLKKPLHFTRMRRLLSQLANYTGKLDPPHTEILGYISSDPSTPRLTSASSPMLETGKIQRFCYLKPGKPDHDLGLKTSKDSLTMSACGQRELASSGIVQSPSDKHLFAHLGSRSTEDFCTSTPESPTSGLITPECANSIADGAQEIKKDSQYGREFENEWKGPVIDLKLPSRVKDFSSQSKSSNTTVEMPTTLTSASESPLTTAPSTPRSHNISTGQVPGALSSMHILLVEDTPVLQRLARMMLKKLGADVTVVGDGLQAVEAVAHSVESTNESQSGSRNAYDLILMDCAMPVMDGYDATKAIRAAELNTGRHIPIVALTAHALASDEEKCLSVGMDAYLTKPINCKQLVSTVQKLVFKENS